VLYSYIFNSTTQSKPPYCLHSPYTITATKFHGKLIFKVLSMHDALIRFTGLTNRQSSASWLCIMPSAILQSPCHLATHVSIKSTFTKFDAHLPPSTAEMQAATLNKMRWSHLHLYPQNRDGNLQISGQLASRNILWECANLNNFETTVASYTCTD
jgi:hypothetical protein